MNSALQLFGFFSLLCGSIDPIQQSLRAAQKSDQAKTENAQDRQRREAVAEIDRRERLNKARGWVIGDRTHLMWATKESRELDWNTAKRSCLDLRTGGFRNWRLPTIDELGDFFTHRDIDSVPMVYAWSSTLDRLQFPQSLDLFPGHPSPRSAPKHAVCVRNSGK